jgi:hypothetical protein
VSDRTEYRTIVLGAYDDVLDDPGAWTFPVSNNPPTRSGRTKVFPTRSTLGPTDPDADDTLTTLNIMEVSGGQGIYTINPSSDLNAYWWGVASAEGTDGMTSAREAIMRQPASYTGNCVPVGRIGVSAYALWGTDIHLWDPDTRTWGASQGSVGMVVNTEGIATFNGKMFFPLGSTGYSYASESSAGVLTRTSVGGAATPAYGGTGNPCVHAFVVQRNVLWAITTSAEGHALASSTTGLSGSWVYEADTAHLDWIKIETSFEPHTMAVFPDAQNQRAIWVAGRRGLQIYSKDDMAWIETNLTDVPPHPDFGKAMKVFRPGEALWITGGGGDVIQYTVGGAIVPAAGPGGARDGMPAGKRGSVVSFATDLAHLYGLFQGETATGTSATIVEDTEGGDPIYVPDATAVTSVIAWTGKGWHPVWESSVVGGTPTKIVVADATTAAGGTDYRVFWGLGEECWTMTCRLTTHSSKQAIQTGTGERFATESYLEWGEFNAGSIAVHKLASHVALNMEHASAVDYVEYQYYTDHDHDGTWVTLGRADADASDGDPRIVLPFGLTADEQFSEGLNWHWIRQRLRFVCATATSPPIVRALSLAYLSVPQDAATKAYTVSLPVDRDFSTGQTAEQIIAKLEALLSPDLGEEKFLILKDREQTYRAYISSVTYARAPTNDAPGALDLTVIQIPSGLPTLVGES